MSSKNKSRNRRFARKKALRKQPAEDSAKRDGLTAARRGWGEGKGR